jgi:hypothetical protein
VQSLVINAAKKWASAVMKSVMPFVRLAEVAQNVLERSSVVLSPSVYSLPYSFVWFQEVQEFMGIPKGKSLTVIQIQLYNVW